MKAAEEMKREEFIEKWGASMGHGFTDEELSADLDELLSLPPAEGAEAFVKSKGLNLDYVKGIQLFLNPKYTVIDLMTEFAAQQPKLDPKKVQWSGYGELGNISQKPLQPTAEGAEKLKEMEELFNLEQQLDIPMKDRFHNSAKGKELFAAIQNKPHPTAEGAEEIIESIVESLGEPINIHNHIFEIRPYTVEHKTEWWIFHKEVGSGEPLKQWLGNFATLHAQRIADKMVKDMRQKLFSMRSSKEPMYRLSEADRLMMYGYHDCINEMLMWTKPREI